MIALNELCAEDVSFVANHIIVLLLFGFLLFCRLYDFFHVIDVILLVLYNLFIGLDLSFCTILVSFDLDIFALYTLIVFVELDKFLILVLDFFPQLIDSICHAFVLLLEFVDFVLGLDEVLGVKVTVTTDCLIQVLLVFTFVLYLLILLLQILDLCVLYFQLLQCLVILRVCM